MKAEPQHTTHHFRRGRIAAALCTTGVVAVALGGNLLGVAAQDEAAPVPGEPAAPVTAPAADDQPGEPPATTQTMPTPAPAPTTSAPAPAPAPLTDTTTTDATVPTAPKMPRTQQPAEQPIAPAPQSTEPAASAPAPAPADQAAPAATPAVPPFAGVAGPADGEEATLVECAKARPVKPATKGHAVVEGIGQGAAAGTPAATERCTAAKRPSRRTAGPRRAEQRDRPSRKPLRNAQGVPAVSNPTTSLALPGPVPLGVPNFFIDKFRIPPFLLSIYQAAGIQYGIRWEVLAAINEIETDYGRNLNISSAGALGWMQFMPATWKAYGTDANRDGRKDPFNPVDAIFAAARYLRAAGADEDLRRAIFAYNHADWYVESVLMRARLIGGLPSDLVGSLNGLTQGHFPVFAKARYADDLSERARPRAVAGQNVATPVESRATRRGIDIFAKAGSPAIAVQDGTIVALGKSKRLGRYVRLRDVYGNTYTYAHLKTAARHVPVPKQKTQSKDSIAKELELPKRDPKPTRPASAGRATRGGAAPAAPAATTKAAAALARPTAPAAEMGLPKERLFAHPARRNAFAHGGAQQILEAGRALPPAQRSRPTSQASYGLDRADVVLKPMLVGRRVIAGTILGRIGRTEKKIAPRLHFEIRPAGRGAPRIDPKPILDGWKLLESTAIYRAQGRNALVGPEANRASIGQILLMSKDALAQRVLSNPRIEIYSCGRRDIEAGGVDRRVLATLEFLAASGLKPTVTSLHCGHGFYTAGGNVSAHSSGNAVDIAKINGIPIVGHQGEGSITDLTIRRLLTLQGTIKPSQIISLMTYDGASNTLAMSDHADHIHVGFRPQYPAGTSGSRLLDAVLKPSQWIKLIDRLGRIDNPIVAVKPSKYAIRVPVPRASASHRGE
jgi:murein DD-endopeptidase MepM/ murein hydrolase activator NlpD